MTRDDFAALQGTWKIDTVQVDGAEMPSAMLFGARITIDSNRFRSEGMGATYVGTFSVNPGVTPRQLDLRFDSGPEQGRTALAIYELEGDRWKLCLTTTGSTRPSGFTTTPGSGHAFETLSRVTADQTAKHTSDPVASVPPAAASAFADSEPVPQLEGIWVMTKGTRDGSPLPAMMVGGARREVRNGVTTVTFGGQLFMKAKTSVDMSKHPHPMDYHVLEGAGAGQIQLGLCELAGDILRVIFAQPGQPRPADFSTKPGDGHTLTEWKRTGL